MQGLDRTHGRWHIRNVKSLAQRRSAAALDIRDQGRVVGFDKNLDLPTGAVVGGIVNAIAQRADWQHQRIADVIGVPGATRDQGKDDEGEFTHNRTCNWVDLSVN